MAAYIDTQPRILSLTCLTLRNQKPETTHKILRRLTNMISSLERDRNVASSWAWMHAAVGRQPEILRRSDFYRILHTAKSPNEQMACTLMMREGFRTGEVCVADHQDVDLDYSDMKRSVIYVFDVKDKRHYPLPIHPDFYPAYKDLHKKEGFLVKRHQRFQRYLNQPITRMAVNNMVKKWAKQAGIRDWPTFNPRKLRMFFAKEWMWEEVDEDGRVVKKAGDLWFLSKILRHHEPFTTWIYLQQIVYLEDLDAEMRRLYQPPQFLRQMENMEQ